MEREEIEYTGEEGAVCECCEAQEVYQDDLCRKCYQGLGDFRKIKEPTIDDIMNAWKKLG